MLEVGILKNFDSGTYKAGVQLAGSLTTYFDDISVAKNIPSSALVIGNYVILAIPGGNPKDACVIATWPEGTAGDGGAASGENWVAQLTNKSGASTQEGYVYRLDPDTDDSFDYASEDEDAQVAVAKGVIANNAAGEMVIGGYEDIYVNGTTTRGQFLYFSAANGQAKPSWIRKDGAFAQATANRTGAGLVKAYVFPRERIRKFATVDEESWQNHYLLPVTGSVSTVGVSDWARYAGNPILTKTGTGWESIYLFGQHVIFYEGLFYLFYAARGTIGGKTAARIGVAYSASIYGPYTRYAGNPILDTGAGVGDWDYVNISSCNVIYDQWESNPAYRFKMTYSGYSNAGLFAYGYVYAAHPLGPWTKYAGNPIIAAAAANTASISSIRIGKKFYVYTAYASGGLYIARLYEGSSLTSLTLYGNVLSPGAGGSWDDVGIVYFSIFWNLGIFYLNYTGYDGSSDRIGAATSFDGRNFTKHPHNPTLNFGAVGQWDASGVHFPCILRVDKTYYLFYTGDAGVDFSIGIAEMS